MTETIAGLGVSPPEILLLLGAVALVLARWLPARRRRPLTVVAAAVIVLSAAVLIALGLRWQLVPVVLSAAIALGFAAAAELRRRTGRPARPARRWLAAIGSAASLVLIAVGAVTAWALPRPGFPQPSGPYPVGTTVMQWSDPDRGESGTPTPDDRRTVVVQLWYPAKSSPAHVQRAQYLGRTAGEARVVSQALAGYLGAPAFLFDDVARARSRSVFEAGVATGGGRFPVVLFSPGLGGVRTQNTAWAEDLASRGYVVAALDHPYDSAAVVFDDGRTAFTRIAASGDPDEDERRAVGWTAVRAADLSFVLTQLIRLDRGAIPGPLTGRLDTDRAAATGHSLGGGAALQAAGQDRRFAAVINLDGFPNHRASQPFHQPVLALTHPLAPGESPTYLPRLAEVLSLSTATSYRLTVPGTAHLTFTDAPLYLPPVPAVVGSLGRTAGPDLTAAASARFLDTTLRGGPDDLRSALSRYGDLTVYPADPAG